MQLQHQMTSQREASQADMVTAHSYGHRDQVDTLVPSQMNIQELAQHNLDSVDAFQQGQTHDTRFAFELFRRALVERDEHAWECIYYQYRALVEAWIRRNSAFAHSNESSEFFVTAAFTRFWRAVTPERFGTFSGVVVLLSYLRRCAECAVIDNTRSAGRIELLPEENVSPNVMSDHSSADDVIDRLSRIEFWQYILSQMHDEAESMVIYASYVLGMKPSAIYDQRPDLFESVQDVYGVKRRVLARLRRNQELQCVLT